MKVNSSNSVEGGHEVDVEYYLRPTGKGCDIVETIDGCADLIVVTTGTLSSMGVHDETILHEVDLNNLSKILHGTVREDGKLIKPKNHPKPDIEGALERQLNGQW